MSDKKYDPDDIKLTIGSAFDTGWYQAPDDTFRMVIDGVQIGCSTCKYWYKVNDFGSCGMVESDSNDKFRIEDNTAYRPELVTKKDFICGLFKQKTTSSGK